MADPAPLSAAERRVRASATRWFVWCPLLGGMVMLCAAITWAIIGDTLGVVPILIMLIGGWALAFAFVNVTREVRPRIRGVIVQASVAVPVSALTVWMAALGGGEFVAGLSAPTRAVVAVLQIAAAPAVVWIWLGLLAATIGLFGREDTARGKRPGPPPWKEDSRAHESSVDFRAIELRTQSLTLAIIVLTVVSGVAGGALVVWFGDAVASMGPKIVIVLVGVSVGLPIYLIARGLVRRRSRSCAFAIGDDELRLRVDSVMHCVPFAELQTLVWCRRGDYARIEVRGANVGLSLNVGLATPAEGGAAELPMLPRRVFRRLESAGLMIERSRRDEVVRFRRPR